jgi:hypothetical protein
LDDVNFGYALGGQIYQAKLVHLPHLHRLGVNGHGIRAVINGGDIVCLRASMSMTGKTQNLRLLVGSTLCRRRIACIMVKFLTSKAVSVGRSIIKIL